MFRSTKIVQTDLDARILIPWSTAEMSNTETALFVCVFIIIFFIGVGGG